MTLQHPWLRYIGKDILATKPFFTQSDFTDLQISDRVSIIVRVRSSEGESKGHQIWLG